MAKQSSINQKKYDDVNTLKFTLKLNKKTDKDIIDNLDLKNKQGSVKKLIRNGLKNNDE